MSTLEQYLQVYVVEFKIECRTVYAAQNSLISKLVFDSKHSRISQVLLPPRPYWHCSEPEVDMSNRLNKCKCFERATVFTLLRKSTWEWLTYN